MVAVCFAMLAIWSCKKDEQRIVIKNGTAPVLTASKTAVVLADTAAADTVVRFSWSASGFGYDAAVSYALQFDKKGNNFTKAKTVDQGASLSAAYTVAALNTIANQVGLTAFTADNLEVRVQAKVSDTYPAVYSDSLTLVVTSYLTEPPYADIYLVGDATEGGWDNTKASPIFRDDADAFVYNYTGYLKAGGIKFLGYLGKWAPSWGSNGGTGVVFRPTEADPDPATFSIATAGYYSVQLDLKNNTYSLAPFTETGSTTYASIGIIGDFNNWADIVPMTATTQNPHIWSGTATFSSNTALKFRIAEGWSVNWGTANDTGKLYGKGKQDGSNISIAAGTYKILFNDLSLQYIFIKQ